MFQLPGSQPHSHLPGLCFCYQAANLILTFQVRLIYHAATLILTFLIYISGTRQPPSFLPSWSMFYLPGSRPHSHLPGLCFRYQAATFILTFLVFVSFTRQLPSFSPSWSMFQVPGSNPHSHLPGLCVLPLVSEASQHCQGNVSPTASCVLTFHF